MIVSAGQGGGQWLVGHPGERSGASHVAPIESVGICVFIARAFVGVKCQVKV